MTVDPNEKGAQHKKNEIAKLINFTEEQKIIVDLYILEEKTQERHWKLDPEDNNIYIEWMNGTTLLRNKVNERINMTKAQKMAMNNKGTVQKGNNNIGNNTQQLQQAPQQQDKIIRTNSGKEFTASERPDLAQLANKPKTILRRAPPPPKRYPRRSR